MWWYYNINKNYLDRSDNSSDKDTILSYKL